jgi:hypothetical protein
MDIEGTEQGYLAEPEQGIDAGMRVSEPKVSSGTLLLWANPCPRRERSLLGGAAGIGDESRGCNLRSPDVQGMDGVLLLFVGFPALA